jgi:hypothetical protein
MKNEKKSSKASTNLPKYKETVGDTQCMVMYDNVYEASHNNASHLNTSNEHAIIT